MLLFKNSRLRVVKAAQDSVDHCHRRHLRFDSDQAVTRTAAAPCWFDAETLRLEVFVSVLDQHRDRVGVIRPAVDVVAVNDIEQLGARDAVRSGCNYVDDALSHRWG